MALGGGGINSSGDGSKILPDQEELVIVHPTSKLAVEIFGLNHCDVNLVESGALEWGRRVQSSYNGPLVGVLETYIHDMCIQLDIAIFCRRSMACGTAKGVSAV